MSLPSAHGPSDYQRHAILYNVADKTKGKPKLPREIHDEEVANVRQHVPQRVPQQE